MRRRGAAWVSVVVALAVLSAGCGSHQSPEDALGRGKPATASPNEPVQALLRDRAQRLLAGDVDGYLAHLSPSARSFEEPIARVAVTLPLGKIDMSLNEATISDDGSKFRGASVWLTYAFKELPDDNPFRLRLLYDIDRQQDGSWIITSSKFDNRPFVPPPPALWPRGPVEITRSTHFLVMARPGVPKVAEATAQAEKAYAELHPKLPFAIDERALLVLAKDAHESVENNGPDVAFENSFCNPVPGGDVCRQEERVVMVNLFAVLNPGPVSQENVGTTDGIFQHELAHLALSHFTRPCTTDWVVEGGAMELAGERRTDEWKKLAQVGLDQTSLVEGGYGFANAAVLYLVATFGASKFFDFYQNFKNLPQCTTAERDVRSKLDERLLRRYYRFGVDDLAVFTRDYIRKAVGAT